MSGRRLGRLAAMAAVLAFAVIAGGFAASTANFHTSDFDWGAPVAAVAAVTP